MGADPHLGRPASGSRPPDSEITTADHVALTKGNVVVAGRAVRAGAGSLFAVCVHPKSGQTTWTAYLMLSVNPASRVTIGRDGRILMCGSTRPLDVHYPNDRACSYRHLAEAAVDVRARSPGSFLSRYRQDEAVNDDNYGSALASHPGSRSGGQLQIAGSQPIENAAACPTSVLDGSPVPESGADATGPTGH